MPDLFDLARYPEAPGHRGVDTSIEAAESMEKSAPLLRKRCLDRLKMGPATADEVAAFLELSVLSVRPRFTELYTDGLIYDTGERRPNASGRRAKVWAVEP
ncbi:hypothetical protein C7W88_16950 [Novosphingobium sp. THN1]|uniref:hypothetical protein n=1 Tax=Novosphingobium sp. THN1 TaxID=1016987 RepID=UPI000E4680B7|nr:hypothetical protein [Novosphingobium sp. THN1]AXU20368.1 hypothetical protein C7W88_16950 [Novosphingobium sp. THN1]